MPLLLNDIIADLAAAFPRMKIDRDTLRVYIADLEDLPIDVVDVAVRDLRRTHEWFPTISHIREATAERMLGLPSESEALAQVDDRIRWARERDEAPDANERPDVHPLITEALDSVGGFYALRTAKEPHIVRGQFLRLYRDARSSRIRDVQLSRRRELQRGRR